MTKSRIGKVEHNDNLKQDIDNKWLPIIQKLNPLNIIAESYAKTLAYKIESKRLDAEMLRVREESRIIMNSIDRQYELRMEELMQKRAALVGAVVIIREEIGNKFLERSAILTMSQEAQKQSFRSDISFEEKKMNSEMSILLLQQMTELGRDASMQLSNLIKDLPSIDTTTKLLD